MLALGAEGLDRRHFLSGSAALGGLGLMSGCATPAVGVSTPGFVS